MKASNGIAAVLCGAALCLGSCKSEPHFDPDSFIPCALPNQLSEKQMELGWVLLWEGSDTEAWTSAKDIGLTFPQWGWFVEDGQLCVEENGGQESTNGGDIMTFEMFEKFWLSVDFKLSPGANSGIKYFVNPELFPSTGSAIGCEYQILDDELHPDAKLGVNGNRTLASLYDLIPADKENVEYEKYGWNTAWIVVQGNMVSHWLNGTKVLEYDRFSPEFDECVRNSKFREREGFGKLDSGHILLQDHGNEVRYRNIMLMKLE